MLHSRVMTLTHFLKNATMTHIWLISYAIYPSYDFKFYFWFSFAIIVEIRLRKIFKIVFLKNAWAESNFDCIGICIDMGSMFIWYQFSLNIAFHAYAIIIFMRIVGKINIDPTSMHIIRLEILRWIRIWSQNLISPTHS